MNTNFIAIHLEKYQKMLEKLILLYKIMEVMCQYQYDERTNPGPYYVHQNRACEVVHDIEFILKKDIGPTLEECPYAE